MGIQLWVVSLRRGARAVALVMVAIVLAFVIGEGVPFSRLTPLEWLGMIGMAAICVGLLLGFKREIEGGVVALAGLAVIAGIELAVHQRLPGGWVWPVLAIPGALYLVVGLAERGGGGRAART